MGTNLKIRIIKRIEEISAQEWGSVFPEALENYYFFKNLDESNLPQFSFFYILVYDDNTLVGAASCFLMDFPLDIAAASALKAFSNFIRFFASGILSPKILICGLPMGQGRIGIAIEPGPVIKAICEGMEQIAQEESASIIAFKDFGLNYSSILDESLGDDFLRVDSLPSTAMDINFAGFDEYLNTLSGISRSGLKRKFKKIDGNIKVDLEISGKLEDGVLEQVYNLYLQTSARQEIGLEKLTPDFFRNISKNMPEETKFFLWRIDNKLAAFALCLCSGEYFIDYYLGFDYSIAYKYHLYFVRFRDLMNWCIKNKIKRYEMGPTGYEPKRRLGFDFIPLYIYAKHRNRILNHFFRILVRILQPANFHPVFRELRKRNRRS